MIDAKEALIESTMISEAEAAAMLGVEVDRLRRWRTRALLRIKFQSEGLELPYAFDSPAALAPPFILDDDGTPHYLRSEIVRWRVFWTVPPAEIEGWAE